MCETDWQWNINISTLSGVWAWGKRGNRGEVKKVHKDEFYNVCSTLNFIRVFRPRWLEHVARVGGERRIQGFDEKP